VRLGLIWAQSRGTPARQAVIGRDGALPWHLPEDMAHFREITHGHPVIMGRATWDSLPARFRPLPGRENIVVTRNCTWHDDGATRVGSVAAALEAAGERDTWVIGGAQIYELFVAHADRVEVTEIEIDVSDGDVFAPHLDESWAIGHDSGWLTSENGLRYRFLGYHR
jgi:dihydrofolate reductase